LFGVENVCRRVVIIMEKIVVVSTVELLVVTAGAGALPNIFGNGLVKVAVRRASQGEFLIKST
jgi:hypothetical protein